MVMVSAALGIAMLSTADPSTRDKASIHIPGKRLKPLQFLVPIAKQTYRLIYFNLIASLAYNLVSMLLAGGVLLAAGVVLSPVIGAALMVLQVALLFLITYAIHKKSVTLVTAPKSAEVAKPDSPQIMSQLKPMSLHRSHDKTVGWTKGPLDAPTGDWPTASSCVNTIS